MKAAAEAAAVAPLAAWRLWRWRCCCSSASAAGRRGGGSAGYMPDWPDWQTSMAATYTVSAFYIEAHNKGWQDGIATRVEVGWNHQSVTGKTNGADA